MRMPPSWFQTAIKSFDPFLSVRWGDVLQRWVVERKAVVPDSEIVFLSRRQERARTILLRTEKELAGTIELLARGRLRKKAESVRSTLQQITEELVSAKEGRRIVLFTSELNNVVFDALCLGDISRYGGYSRFADELERKEQAASDEQKRQERNAMEASHKEAYDLWSFLDRKRSAKLDRGERRLSELLK